MIHAKARRREEQGWFVPRRGGRADGSPIASAVVSIRWKLRARKGENSNKIMDIIVVTPALSRGPAASPAEEEAGPRLKAGVTTGTGGANLPRVSLCLGVNKNFAPPRLRAFA